MFAPGIPRILAEYHETSSVTATFILSVYILGFAFGPLVIAPMSEIYGRSLLYNIGNVFFTIFSICTALSNGIGMMMAFRFLMGVAGSVPITIGSGSIADMMPVEMRGRAMAAWALGPLLGPCIGPVAGGYLIRAAGWRWVYWLIAILAGIITVFTYFTLKESYAPVILEKKAARLRNETGNQELRSALAIGGETPVDKVKLAIVRPLKLLFLAPIVTAMSLYVAITCESRISGHSSGFANPRQTASCTSSSPPSAWCSLATTDSARVKAVLSSFLRRLAWRSASASSARSPTSWSRPSSTRARSIVPRSDSRPPSPFLPASPSPPACSSTAGRSSTTCTGPSPWLASSSSPLV